MIKIKTLLENRISQNRFLKAQHGLSFLVEYEDTTILFDCGATEAALYNARKMNVDLAKIDAVLLSHSHYDHAAGYPEFVEAGVTVPLYVGTHFWEEKYAKKDGKYTYLGCGFSKELCEQHHITCKEVVEKEEIAKGCFVVTGFMRTHEFETIPERFVKDTNQGFVPDVFEDEICLVMEHEKGLVVVLGCSHPGILNILTTIKSSFGKPIYAVFGGTHLVEATPERVKETVEAMKDMGTQVLGFNHCTSEAAEEAFDCCSLKTGDCIIL